MKISRTLWIVPVIACTLLVGCGSNEAMPSSGGSNNAQNNAPTDSTGTIAVPVRTTLKILSRAYTSSDNLWTGFNALDNPSVVVFRDGDKKTTHIIALNFESLAVLGTYEAIDVEGAPYTAVKVTEPSSDLEARITSLRNFDFTADIGGVSTYMIAITEGEPGISPDTFEFGQYFIHEMFHRYQIIEFRAPQTDQSLATYPFTVDNIELAILEERALKAALESSDRETMNSAIKHFSALRLARRSAESRVDLDDSQETYEGSARYLEHKMAGNDTTVSNNQASFGSNLVTNPGKDFTDVKDHFGFGRFYASGAAIIELIDRVGVSNYQGTIQNDDYAASVLIRYADVEAVDVENVVQQARDSYDSQGALRSVAQALVAISASEPNSPGGEGDGESDGIDITPAQLQCLKDLGVDVDDPDVQIPQSAINQCILGAS